MKENFREKIESFTIECSSVCPPMLTSDAVFIRRNFSGSDQYSVLDNDPKSNISENEDLKDIIECANSCPNGGTITSFGIYCSSRDRKWNIEELCELSQNSDNYLLRRYIDIIYYMSGESA